MKRFLAPRPAAQRSLNRISFILISLFFVPREAPGLISVGGDQPVRDHGWPNGTTELANLESRDSWWEGPPFGGGEYHFNYSGDAEDFAEAVEKFLEIRAPNLEIHIRPGTCNNSFGRKEGDDGLEPDVDWEFVVWRPSNWNQLHNNPETIFLSDAPGFREPVPVPRLVVYLGHSGALKSQNLHLPDSKGRLEIVDHRASSRGIETQGAAVRASAFDAQSGKVLEDAVFTLKPRRDEDGLETLELKIGASGLLEHNAVSPGLYFASISAPGYASRSIGYPTMNPDEFFDYSVYLEKATTVSGTVVDSQGNGIQDVKVSVNSLIGSDGRGYSTPHSLETTTNEVGHYEISGVPNGFLVYRTYHPEFNSDPSLRNTVPTSEEPQTLRMSQAGELQVTVRNISGQPMSKLKGKSLIVEIEPKGGSIRGSWGGSATVDQNGEFLFKNVPPGDYIITSRPNPGRSDKEYAAPVEIKTVPGKTTEVVVTYKE